MAKTKQVKSFSVGDRVKWKSQAGGHWKEKIGTVIEVVPAHKPCAATPMLVGTRAHESYIVEVDKVRGGKRQRQTLYWPLVGNLKLVRRGSTSSAEAAPSVSDPAPAVAAPEVETLDDDDDNEAAAEGSGDPYLAGIINGTDAAHVGLDRARDNDLSGNSNADVASSIN